MAAKSSDPASLNQALVQRSFPGAFGKGISYFREGRVELEASDATSASGAVSGHARQPYNTEVFLSGQGPKALLHGVCSCPLGGSCKHCVALALAWIERRAPRDALEPYQRDPDAPVELPAAPADPWKDLDEPRASGTTPAGEPATLFYLVATEVRGCQLLLRAVLATRAKGGRWNKGRVVPMEDETTLQKLDRVPNEDLARLVALRPANTMVLRDDAWWIVLRPRDDAALESMVATGRVRYAHTNGPALALGPRRALAFAWTLADDGTQRLALRLAEGSGTVSGDGRWYVDPAQGLMGRTDAGPLDDEVAMLSHLPPIEPERHDDAKRALERRGLWARLPQPRALRTTVRRARQLRAVLTLARPPYEAPGGGLPSGMVAMLAFRYDDVTLDPADHRAAVRAVRPADSVDVLVREPAFERTVVRWLRREGWRETQGWSSYGDRRSTWTNAMRLAGDQVARWLAKFVERAAEFSIEVETEASFPVYLGIELGAPELALDDSGDWFEAKLGVEVDGQKVDLIPIVIAALTEPGALGEQGLELRLPDGRRARLARERLEPILALLRELETREGRHGVARERLPALAPPPDWRFLPGPRAREFLDELTRFTGLESVQPSADFRAALRPYQASGLAWLDFLRRFRFGGILADDMGLGKTVQVLAFLARERAEGRLERPALVVCPTSVGPNWVGEARRFAPGLRVAVLERGDRRALLESLAEHDLVVTSYALMVRDGAALAAVEYSVVVFDEAQNLKNDTSKSYRAAIELKAPMRLCLTGTPVENHLGELKAQCDLAMPGLLGTARGFKQQFRTPIERENDAAAADALRRRLKPFLLRRTKAEVAAELPPRTRIEHAVVLEDAQRDLYETLRARMEKRVREALAERGIQRSHITLLDALLKLRQVCCDPRLVDLPAARKVTASAKREALMDLVPTLVEDGRAALVFSQFTSMLDLIAEDLDVRGLPYVRLDGETRDRSTPVARFQRGEVPLFLISLKAGGVGLNLTRADTVILYDPWWNPAAEAQAIDRAHRIGQDKPVFVYELLCTGTIEEKMQALKAKKRDIAAAVLDHGDAAIAALTADDLLSLFAVE
jgi:superfamily II DNA or RNA helicase